MNIENSVLPYTFSSIGQTLFLGHWNGSVLK